jgi:putative transposase
MKIRANQLYHIYNQGNNRERIFREKNDYLNFLTKFCEKVLPFCEVMAYCLMPNHFHFLINATQESSKPLKLGNIETSQLANGFRLCCSSYANDYNKKYNRTGSLFRQKTQAKNLGDTPNENYPFICFQYIHQNPMTAGLVDKMEDWEFSSFRCYNGVVEDVILKKELSFELLGVSRNDFYKESYEVVDNKKVRGIFVA